MIVVTADPASTPKPALPTGRSNLVLRIASSVVLAPLAVVAAYVGGVAFLLFWTIAALIVLWEWDALVCAHDKNPVLTIGSVAIVGACTLAALDRAGFAILFLALGMMRGRRDLRRSDPGCTGAAPA
jgi:phosphatidate cytidylyltransferase